MIAVADGFQLQQKAAEHRPHLIIADVQLPGVYGTSAMKVVHGDSYTASTPVIFISAHPQEGLDKVLPRGPHIRFLKKPMTLAALDEAIAELLPMRTE